MNLKEYAELNDITLADAKKRTGLTHWNANVPESCDEIEEVAEDADISELVEVVEEAVDAVEDIVEEVVEAFDKADVTPEQAFSIFILGNKSPYWTR